MKYGPEILAFFGGFLAFCGTLLLWAFCSWWLDLDYEDNGLRAHSV
jgi:hypothetical protein